ncbi:MAG TPA: hypothetical protein ENO13_02050 [Candidatus Bathyarchaeota archaeon]|jgi:K+-transporting ATPase A subunit|nr:hypothetical protein [Candidatus Bathyarchaeota archaeon]
MESKNLIAFGCWISVTVIAVVYMLVFGQTVGDIMYGVFMPIGMLLLFAFFVTIIVVNDNEPKQNK